MEEVVRRHGRMLRNMAARGVISKVSAGRKMQSLQVRLLAGEVKDNVEHFEPYGYTAHPHTGAEAITLFFDGDRSHGVVLVVADRRYRLQGLEAGEVALHDDQGQKVVIKRDRIQATAPLVEVVASAKVRMVTPLLEVTGEIRDRCDTDGKTMEQMRSSHDAHRHNETGSLTSVPTVLIG